MKNFYKVFIFLFMIYAIFMSYYLFQTHQALPSSYAGGPADPATFMTSQQLQTATIFSRIKDFLFFMGVPWEWAIYLFVLGTGLSTAFYFIAKKIHKRSLFLQASIYVFLLSIVMFLLQFPLKYYSYKVSRDYGISVQPFEAWMTDQGKSILLDLVITIPMVWILYTIIRKSPKKWWFWFWLISIPLTIMMYFIQPVVIDPIFNDFQSLQNQELKGEILALAERADIPADQVYQVNMSKKTTAMNAYVTGIGSNARIVLWDTTLNKLEKDEILFIMAHEMGHYVYHHIYWMLLGSIIASFFLFYFVYRLVHWVVRRFGHYWGIERVAELNSLPVFLLLLSLLNFTISPIENTISRYSERAADEYGIRMTHNPDAAIRSFQKLTINSLTEPNPPELVKVFLYTHPTMVERLYTISNETKQIQKQNTEKRTKE
ncbi:M48 family metallopeptidase [Tepidibacillus fermentans]|uniref:Zn-dependent protease with chaperone function n=1 Tax=Tepidibacillus fermentans TaxID=1281767 RepID=A0A4R3K960_9BACI|nr:M48 family metallopeptidase [Tepidibacillus fermentans]TCS79383.1 Zn-dependent protease with chaperone function [Tepidibacillus fermentans]